jgi:hypothetical protein
MTTPQGLDHDRDELRPSRQFEGLHHSSPNEARGLFVNYMVYIGPAYFAPMIATGDTHLASQVADVVVHLASEERAQARGCCVKELCRSLLVTGDAT